MAHPYGELKRGWGTKVKRISGVIAVDYPYENLKDGPSEVGYFKNKPVLKDVLAIVERVAE